MCIRDRSELSEVQAQIAAGADLSHDSMGKALAKITADIEGIRPSVSVKSPFFSYASHLETVLNYRHEDTFKSALFHGLPFPRGSTSYVGARTGRGKSAALVNLAREGLNDGKAVLFVTLELSTGQLFNRFLLSKQWEMNGRMTEASVAEQLPKWAKYPDGKVNTQAAVNYWLKEIAQEQKPLIGKGIERRCPAQFREALECTKDNLASGRLALVDVRGFTIDRLIQTIRESDADMVMLDYVQKLPAISGQESASRQVQIQGTSQKIVDLSVQTNRIFIAAAQFNRMDNKKGEADVFDDSSFREAGDLEQDSHNAVGIGWPANKQGRFYEVLKARESHHTGQKKYIQWDGEHGFMGADNREYTAPQNEQGKGTGKRSQPAGDREAD